ncbi:MAG: hypothetical protein ACPGTS_01600 [Minisyncoccia bacterium]
MKELILQISYDPKFLLGFTAHIFYFYAIWKSRNSIEPMKPVRVSWFIFFILNILILANEVINGKNFNELGLQIGYLFGSFLVFFISIPYGEWIQKTSKEKISQEYYVLGLSILAGITYVFLNGVVSIIFLGIALITGAYPNIMKLWKKPQSEVGAPYLMWFIAASLAVYDLGHISQWNFVSALIPCVYLGLNIPIAWSIGNRK